MKPTNKGMILLVSLIVMMVLSITLPAYVIWSIWDQKSLLRQQNLELANSLAQAGLNRSILDLHFDTDSWLDGKINTTVVTLPNGADPNAFYPLYSDTATFSPEPLSYSVEIRYLYDTANSRFYDRSMWVRATGNAYGSSRILSELVNGYVVKNITRNISYMNIQPAVAQVDSSAWDNDNIGITDSVLTENVNIAGARRYNIRGCYDPDFNKRACSHYHSIILGNLAVSGNANVRLSGVTLE